MAYIEEQLNLLSSAVEQAMDGIAINDADGNFIYLNKALAEMHGYTPEELVGKNVSIIHAPEQRPMTKEIADLINAQSDESTINKLKQKFFLS